MSLFSLLTMRYQNILIKCEKWSQDILVFEFLSAANLLYVWQGEYSVQDICYDHQSKTTS